MHTFSYIYSTKQTVIQLIITFHMNKNDKKNTGAQGAAVENKQNVQVIDITPKLQPSKTAMNLEQTISVVMGLGRKIKAAQNLKTQASQLEEFEIKNEGEYMTHKLVIEDSSRRSFSTNDPQLIKDVVEFIRIRIWETVKDLEANIILPA